MACSLRLPNPSRFYARWPAAVLLRRLLGLSGALLALPTVRAAEPSTNAPATVADAVIVPVSGRDLALDLQHDALLREKGEAAAYALLAEAFAKDPRPHVKARYGEYLLNGKEWGAPDGRREEGLAMAEEALRAGSVHALRVVGWELLTRKDPPPDRVRGLGMLLHASTLGNSNAAVFLGNAYFWGYGVPPSLDQAETWFMQAANAGHPYSLVRLGQHYETLPNGMPHACQLYYEAAVRGSGSAFKRLNELVKQGIPEALRARKLEILWSAAAGESMERSKITEAIGYLETNFAEDPAVLLGIARVHIRSRNSKLAVPYLDKAIRLGSQDARAQRARLLAEGYGLKKDEAAALAELRELEAAGNAEALAQLGYYQYWGSLKSAGLAKDPVQAFACSKRAADRGNFFAQRNAGICYEFGIGVPVDFALAAYYYHAAAWRGDRVAEERGRNCLRHVK